MSVLFGDFPSAPDNYEQMQRQNTGQYAAFFHSMLSSGISLPPSAFETWFVSATHCPEALEQVAKALPKAAQQAAAMPAAAVQLPTTND